MERKRDFGTKWRTFAQIQDERVGVPFEQAISVRRVERTERKGKTDNIFSEINPLLTRINPYQSSQSSWLSQI
jgi:hypothetical protein